MNNELVNGYSYNFDTETILDYHKYKLQQNDVLTNEITIKMAKGGIPLDLTGLFITLNFITPQKTMVTQTSRDSEIPITISGNEIACKLRKSVLENSGEVQVQLQIANETQLIHSQTFDFAVLKSLDAALEISKDNDLPILQSLISEMNNLITGWEQLIIDNDLINKIANIDIKENERITNETTRKSNELERITLYNNLLTLKSQLETLQTDIVNNFNTLDLELKETLRLAIESMNTQLSQALSNFETLSQASLTQFAQDSQLALTNLQTEIDRVQTLYLAELNLKANKKQEEWITPTLLNGATATGVGYEPQYFKDDFGVVHLRGRVNIVATGSNNRVFSLPPGYRWSATYGVLFAYTFNKQLIRLGMYNDRFYSDELATNLILDGLSFRAED